MSEDIMARLNRLANMGNKGSKSNEVALKPESDEKIPVKNLKGRKGYLMSLLDEVDKSVAANRATWEKNLK